MGVTRTPLVIGALGALVVALAGDVQAQVAPVTVDFTTVGSDQFTVPADVCEVTVEAFGAQGGAVFFGALGSAGGLGGSATATLEVTPGEVLDINVGGAGGDATGSTGGAGGPGGGGAGGTLQFGLGSGGGGGLSAVQRTGTVLVAAGGAGGGGGTIFDRSEGGAGGGDGTDGAAGSSGATGGRSGGNGGAGGLGDMSVAGADGASGSPGQGGGGGANFNRDELAVGAAAAG